MAVLSFACLSFCLPVFGLVQAQEVPRRVVSMNVCTDQLAMLVADEGQLHSVSVFAGDPNTSVLSKQAGKYIANNGHAEEVFLMQPDLVVAGIYTAQPAVQMLRRLGFRVEIFTPENSFEDIRNNITRMGALLHREERAAELVTAFDARLKELEQGNKKNRSAVLYSSNTYTAGEGTLSHAVMEAAGLQNITDRLGIEGIQRLSLEQLVLAEPDLIVLGEQHYELPALAQEIFRHPAFTAMATRDRLIRIPDRYWVCGGPFTLEAVGLLREAAMHVSARIEQAEVRLQ